VPKRPNTPVPLQWYPKRVGGWVGAAIRYPVTPRLIYISHTLSPPPPPPLFYSVVTEWCYPVTPRLIYISQAHVHVACACARPCYQVTLTAELQEMESLIAQVVTAAVWAEQAMLTRISTLQQQLGGGNWLSAVGRAKESAAAAQRDADKATAKAKELQDLVTIGPRLRASGDRLLGEMGSEAATHAAGHNDLLHKSMPMCADEVDLSPRRVDQLLQHLEKELFAAGGGDVNRTRLLLSQLTMRPATQRLLQHDKVRSEKLVTTALAMLAKANDSLKQLTAGVHGSRTLEDHTRFEIIVQALTPDDATEGPKNLERGGRPYWLLRTLGKAVRLTSKRRAWAAPNAPTIPTKTWVVLAQWYLSTAADHHSKRQGYKLLDGHAYIRVSSIIQEHGLEFQHEGRSSKEFASESTLKAESHARLQEHNFASYV